MRRGLHVIVLAACVASAGCGWRQEPVGERAERYPLTALDSANQAIVVPAQPSTIITTEPEVVATLKAIGSAATVTLTTPGAVASGPPAADLVVVGSGVQVAAGTAVFRYGADELREANRAIARLGLAVGRAPEAIDLGETVRKDVEAVLTEVADRPRVRVYVDAGGLRSLGPESELGRVLSALGGDVVEGGGIDAVRKVDPEVWLVVKPGTSTAAGLKQVNALAKVSAVKTGRVHKVDTDIYRPGPELAANLRALARLLHPDLPA